MKLLRIAVLAGALLAVAALVGVGRPEGARGVEAEPEGGITVSGLGSVPTVPDQVDLSFGARTHARTAREALDGNSADVAKVIAALRAAGISSDDIRTQSLAIYPRYSDDGETLVGYTASNTVLAHVRDLVRAGGIIDAAVSAGANQVSGLSFVRSDETELYRDALKAAITDARGKARVLAAESGVTLGKVIRVVEEGGAVPFNVMEDARALADAPIEPGKQEVKANVSVTFAVA